MALSAPVGQQGDVTTHSTRHSLTTKLVETWKRAGLWDKTLAMSFLGESVLSQSDFAKLQISDMADFADGWHYRCVNHFGANHIYVLIDGSLKFGVVINDIRQPPEGKIHLIVNGILKDG